MSVSSLCWSRLLNIIQMGTSLEVSLVLARVTGIFFEFLWVLILVLLSCLSNWRDLSSVWLSCRLFNTWSLIVSVDFITSYESHLVVWLTLILITGGLVSHFLILLFSLESIILSIRSDDGRCKSFMGLEVTLLILSDLLVLFIPLTLHLVLEVLADLEVVEFILEYLLDKDLVDVLEMNVSDLTLIDLNLISLQYLQNVFFLYKNLLFFVNVERVCVVHTALSRDKGLLTLEFAQGAQAFVAEWSWKLNNQADEVCNTNPTCGKWIVFHPDSEQLCHIIS